MSDTNGESGDQPGGRIFDESGGTDERRAVDAASDGGEEDTTDVPSDEAGERTMGLASDGEGRRTRVMVTDGGEPGDEEGEEGMTVEGAMPGERGAEGTMPSGEGSMPGERTPAGGAAGSAGGTMGGGGMEAGGMEAQGSMPGEQAATEMPGEQSTGDGPPGDDTGEMPGGEMAGEGGGMPTGGMNEPATDQPRERRGMEVTEPEDESGDGGRDRVLVELYVQNSEEEARVQATTVASRLSTSSFQLDEEFAPVPMEERETSGDASRTADGGQRTVLVRGTVDRAERETLAAEPDVAGVFDDADIQLYEAVSREQMEFLHPQQEGILPSDHVAEEQVFVEPSEAATAATCPIPDCDCEASVPKGTISDVASYLGVNDVWSDGYRGDGITVGVVDAGVHAQDDGGDIPNVAGGWPPDAWGTTTAGKHGHMSATDVLGMAPEARLYDVRIFISGTSTISNAIEGFQWAIERHRDDGTPQILTNSWGLVRKDTDAATDPNHPFTRKVEAALGEGILLLFAAGNCGETCPSGSCHSSAIGPGNSILGANGHPDVMTVGAANTRDQYAGYSAQGPATLDPDKPDFCSITHFTGYFRSDNGTSAATPVAAGVTALMKQKHPSLTQQQAKAAFAETAKDIGPEGWDPHSGAGIIKGDAAIDRAAPGRWRDWEDLGGRCLHGVDAASWAEDRIDTFVVGTDSGLYHKWWDGSRWRGFEDLGGVCISEPAAVSWDEDRIDTFVVGTDNELYHKWWDGSRWRGFESLGGRCIYGVDAASWAEDRLDTFVVGTNNQLYHKWWNGSEWRGFESLGGVCISEPAAVSWGEDRIDTFVVGTDNELYHKWWDGSRWRGFESLGGRCIRGVAASSRRRDHLDVFTVGVSNRLFHKTWDGDGWSDWESLGGVCTSAPAAVSWGRNRIDAFVLGTDSQLWHRYYA